MNCNEAMNDWPLVDKNDDGIRPAGKPDECSYCWQKVGEPHKRDCVCVTKLIRIRYTIDIPVQVPHYWDANQIEFHRNESSWCTINLISELEAYAEGNGCICGITKATYLETIDETPVRELKRVEPQKEGEKSE